MDPSQLRTTSGLPLDELVAHALSELERVNYSRRAVRRYRMVWAKLVAFSRERNPENRYSEELAAEFVAAYSQQPAERVAANEECRRHIPFVVKVLVGAFAGGAGYLRSVRLSSADTSVPLPSP